MSKSLFTRAKDVLLETAQEFIFGFDTAHPERAKALQEKEQQGQRVKETQEIDRAIAKRKQQLRTMRANEEPSREKGRNH